MGKVAKKKVKKASPRLSKIERLRIGWLCDYTHKVDRVKGKNELVRLLADAFDDVVLILESAK